MKLKFSLLTIIFIVFSSNLSAQPDESQLGAWYMYFWNTSLKGGPWGFQGDYQFRNWNVMGDLEQLLLRSGVTYQPKGTSAKFTLGYGFVATGEFRLDKKSTKRESRIYQEALIPHKIGSRFYLTHRYRYEQRWVQDQDFRTRYRYNLFLNIPLNQDKLAKGTVYLALYNELFINGQRDIGDGRTVELFDRNRFYSALGYGIFDGLRMQLGYMRQTTDNWTKGQLQVSLHHKF